MIVSAFAHLTKPDRHIYERLAYTYGIALEESLFVDDVPLNVVAAGRVGMRGMVYTGDPPDVLE